MPGEALAGTDGGGLQVHLSGGTTRGGISRLALEPSIARGRTCGVRKGNRKEVWQRRPLTPPGVSCRSKHGG